MKILLTGALGYIGCETLLRFAQRPDITVYALDNDVNAIRERGAYFLRYPNIKIINADITKEFTVPDVDIVVHLAAMVGYMACNTQPEHTQLVNVVGTRNVVELGKPTVFFSTGSVYGEIGDSCDESVPVNPRTVYAITKHQGEEIVKAVPHVIFRPATAFGLGMKTRHDLLPHDLTRQAVANQGIELYQPDARRSFYSVQKIAELIEYTCDHFELFENNIFNVGCESGNIVKKRIIGLIQQQIDFDCRIVKGADADTRDYNVHYAKLKAVWPNYSEDFESRFPAIVEYYRQCKA